MKTLPQFSKTAAFFAIVGVFIFGTLVVVWMHQMIPEGSKVLSALDLNMDNGWGRGISNTIRIPETETSFNKTSEVIVSEIPFTTERYDSLEYFIGEEVTTHEGVKGELTQTFEVFHWDGFEVERQVISEEKIDPQSRRIAVGTKRNYRTLETPDGMITYYQSHLMWATSYDGNCRGCTGKTYAGGPVKHGVCAVDPRVIPLYQEVYIPGYGLCNALDIGGGIKGNTIDLGFDSVKNGWWSSRWTPVYIVEN